MSRHALLVFKRKGGLWSCSAFGLSDRSFSYVGSDESLRRGGRQGSRHFCQLHRAVAYCNVCPLALTQWYFEGIPKPLSFPPLPSAVVDFIGPKLNSYVIRHVLLISYA